ncbi:MAG: 50S ribosomal protein L30 [Pseudomonadota bacterium]|nr:50S ribosomal protein L30 [Pseudomonadota bacterium]
MAVKTVTIKLIKSPTGRLKKHKACVAGLGLRRIGDEVKVEDTASVRGMIDKIDYLINVGGGN